MNLNYSGYQNQSWHRHANRKKNQAFKWFVKLKSLKSTQFINWKYKYFGTRMNFFWAAGHELSLLSEYRQTTKKWFFSKFQI